MDQVHLHLMLTHFPIVGTVFGLLILIAGAIMKNTSIKRTALSIFVISSLLAIPAFLTGEGAEEVAEKLQGVSEINIESHEEVAEIYIWLVSALGVLSALTLVSDFMNHKLTRTMYFITFIISIITAVVSYRVGNFGGEIRHSEIRNDNTPVSIQKNSNQHDDD